MNPPPDIAIREADWGVDGATLSLLREEVFIMEQSVPASLELDEFDGRSRHVLATANGLPIGTGRLLPDGHIGRMAVLKAWRRMGAGSALLIKLLGIAKTLGMQRVLLNAQLQALPFYLRHGFRPEGKLFIDAGILHVRMTRDL
jgi:predicted GNAT family N-acyltransferase